MAQEICPGQRLRTEDKLAEENQIVLSLVNALLLIRLKHYRVNSQDLSDWTEACSPRTLAAGDIWKTDPKIKLAQKSTETEV